MLQRSERIEDADQMLWELSLVLLLAWILTYACVVQGKVRESGVRDQCAVALCIYAVVEKK